MLLKNCVSDMGRECLEQLRFSAEISNIQLSLEQTDDMLRLMREGLPFSVRDYFDLRHVFHHLRIEGTIIEQEDLFDLKVTLGQLQQLLQFLASPHAEEYLALKNMATGLAIDKMLLRELTRIMNDKGEIPDNASPQLADIRQDIRRKQGTIDRKIRQMLGESKASGWSDSSAEVTIRNGRMVIPVRAADKRKIRGFIHDESATGQTIYIEPAEIFDTNNEIRELEYAEKREILRILAHFTNLLRPSLNVLLEAWDFLGAIDFCHAKALFAVTINARKPEFVNRPLIDWKQAVHPLLEMTLKEQKKHAIPLDLYLHNEERILVISGPNAGGKSVCLKTTGLLQYMFQCGLHVPVNEGSYFGVFSKLFIDIGDEQSLENDLSTYSSHLLHMKAFLDFADESSLFLIDEFGTGTEPQSGGAIAETVLEELNNRHAFGLVTTHYANLKLLADNADGIVNGAMLYDNKKLQPLYVLRIGKPGSSFAFEIARKTGIPETILEKAASITGHSQLNFEQQLQQLDIEKADIARKQQELRIADNLLNEVIEKYKRLNRQLEERKRSLMNEAGKEAQALIDKANRKIELTIKEIREAQAEKEKTKLLREQLQAMKPELQKDAQQKAESLQKAEEEPVDQVSLKVGDLVRIDEMDVVGELLLINEHEAVVAFNAIKLRTSPEKLSKLDKKSARAVQQQTRKKNSYAEDLNEKIQQFKLTIDVRGKRAEEAMELVGKYIDESLLLSIKEVSILHGKGNGILRKVLRDYLSRLKEVAAFEDAPIEAGGTGITRVKLR